MLKQEAQTLWKNAAVMMGASVPLLLLGPAPTVVLLLLGLACGLVATHGTSLRSTMAFIAQSRVVPLVAAVYGALFLSAIFSVDAQTSMAKFGDLLGIGALAVAFYVTLREMPPRHIELTYKAYSTSIIAVAAVCLLDILWNDPRLSNLLHGDMENTFARLHHMSSVFAIMLPFLFAWLIRMQREAVVMAHWFAVPIALATWIILFLCGGITGWVTALITGATFLYLITTHHNVRVTPARAALTILGFLAGPAAYIAQEGWQNTLDYIGFGAPEKAFYNKFLPIWNEALHLIQDNPITGAGLHTYRQLSDTTGALHPHNAILQLMVETGAIGTVVILAFIGVVLRYFYAAARTNLYGVAGFCSMLAFTLAAMMFTSIFNSWWLILVLFNGLFAARVGYAHTK